MTQWPDYWGLYAAIVTDKCHQITAHQGSTRSSRRIKNVQMTYGGSHTKTQESAFTCQQAHKHVYVCVWLCVSLRTTA